MALDARQFWVDINLGMHQLLQARIETLVADPEGAGLVEARLWYNSTTKQLRYFNGASASTLAVGDDLTTAVTRANAAAAAGILMVSADADRTARSYAGGAGIVKADAAGAASPAVPGTDYLTGDSANALTNKTIDANGTGNSVTNLEVADFASTALGTVTENSATKLVTSQDIKVYVDGVVAGLGKLVGMFDAFPGLLPTTGSGAAGAIVAGDHWRVTVAGDIVGLGHLEIGDVLMAGVNGAAVAADFFALQANLTDVVSSDGNPSTDNALVRFDGASGKIVQNSLITVTDQGSTDIPAGQAYMINGVDILTQNSRKYAAAFNDTTDWVGASAPFALTIAAATHGLGATEDLIVGVRDASRAAVTVGDHVSATGDITLYSGVKFAGRITIVG